MTTLGQEILRILSDGKFHSGQAVAKELSVTRAAVWKQIVQLKEKGAEVFSVKGKGYRIPGGLDLLNKSYIQRELEQHFSDESQIEVFSSIASTSQYLMSTEQNSGAALCLAEYQSSGRGRLGRVWHSPFARNIYLSLRYRLPLSLNQLSGLSLAVGCSLVNCLQKDGVERLKLKWPNDLRIDGRKVGGILLEVVESSEVNTDVVIGIGLNWDMPDNTEIDQHWTNLKPHTKRDISRNQLVVGLIKQLFHDLKIFSEEGFIAFKEEWRKYDELFERPVSLIMGKTKVQGQAIGVDDSGALLINRDGEILSFSGGEVSVRLSSCS